MDVKYAYVHGHTTHSVSRHADDDHEARSIVPGCKPFPIVGAKALVGINSVKSHPHPHPAICKRFMRVCLWLSTCCSCTGPWC